MNRSEQIAKLTSTGEWDIIIVGGGATGLGCALDAASRGYNTLLLEKKDFAKGTSSKATKLVHGGVRYLAQGNIKLVKEALKERGLLLKNAPHVCHVQTFIIPCYSYFKKWYYAFGLKVYDLLAGKWGIGKSKMVSAKYVSQHLPFIKNKKLAGGVMYNDGQFDDARLAVDIAQTACGHGATVLNYIGVTSFICKEDKITGITAYDAIGQKEYTLHTKVVINATGVFADEIMRMAGDSSVNITPSQGVHLVIDKKQFKGPDALMIPKTTDGRVLFAVPWHDKVILGTTDTEVTASVDEPVALPDEIDFILSNFNAYAASPVAKEDIRAVFTGLRPLIKKEGIKNTAALNRSHAVIISKNNLVTITGGKWTTYRKMAEDAINNAAYVAKLPKKKCITSSLPIASMAGEYLLKIENGQPELTGIIHPGYPFKKAQVIYSVRYEMAQNVEDFLARRIRLLFLDAEAAVAAAGVVAKIMQDEMNKTNEWAENQVTSFTELAEKYQIHQQAVD